VCLPACLAVAGFRCPHRTVPLSHGSPVVPSTPLQPLTTCARIFLVLARAGMVCYTVEDVRSEEQLSIALNPVIAAKQAGLEPILSPLVARACLNVMPPAPKRAVLNVDNVRVCKLIGGSIGDSTVIKGVVVLRTTEVRANPCRVFIRVPPQAMTPVPRHAVACVCLSLGVCVCA
jgi:hypothetical protein